MPIADSTPLSLVGVSMGILPLDLSLALLLIAFSV